MPGLDTDRGKTHVNEACVNPLWSGLQTDALKRLIEFAQQFGNSIRSTINRRFEENPPIRVQDANGGRLHGDIETSKQ